MIDLIGSVAAGLIINQLVEGLPVISRAIIKKAAQRLSPAMRERFEEEWRSHLADCPGGLAKLSHALGCVVASLRMRVPFARHLRYIRVYCIVRTIEVVVFWYTGVRARQIEANAGIANRENRPPTAAEQKEFEDFGELVAKAHVLRVTREQFQKERSDRAGRLSR